MNIAVGKEMFQQALMNASKSILNKPSLPILASVHLQAMNRTLCVSGYNLNTVVTTEIDCEIIDEGIVVLPLKKLLAIVKKAKSRMSIFLQFAHEKLIVKFGNFKFTLNANFILDYPDFFHAELKICSLDAEAFKQVSFAMSRDASKFGLCGLFIKTYADTNQIDLVATDTWRLAHHCPENVSVEVNKEIILPDDLILLTEKIMSGKVDILYNFATAQVSIKSSSTTFNLATITISQKAIYAIFPNYKKQLKDSYNPIKIKHANIVDIIKTIFGVANQKFSKVALKFSNKLLEISTTDNDYNVASGNMLIEFDGRNQLSISLNTKFLLEILATTKEDFKIDYIESDPIFIKTEKSTFILMKIND